MCKFWKLEKSNHHFPELNQRRQRQRLVFKFLNKKSSAVLLVILTAALGLAYLAQINLSATKGYQIKDLQDKLEALKIENKKLNLQYVESQSIAKVVSQVDGLGLVASGRIEILTPVGSAVALNNLR